MTSLPNLIRKITIVISLILLIGIIFQHGSIYPAYAAAGDVTQTTYDDFSTGCSSLSANTTHISDAGGGAIELAATLSDDFLTPLLNSSFWSTGLWGGPGTYAPSISSGFLTIQGDDHAWVRSASTYTRGILEVNALFGNLGSQHVGFASDAFEANRYIFFSTGAAGDGNLHARVNNNVSEVNIDLGPIPTEFHRYRIEWSELDSSNDQADFYIDGIPVATVPFPNADAANFFLYLSNNGSADLQIDSGQSARVSDTGIYTSCQFDAGADALWNTLSWDATLTLNTTVDAEISTSIDGINWGGWVAQSNGGAITTPTRWLQYRLTLNSSNLNETPLVNSVTRSSVLAQADLGINKTASTPSITPNGALVYTLKVANFGPDTAYGVQVQDVLPPGFVFSNVAGSGWTSCVENSGTVTCTMDRLDVGDAPDITINGNAPTDGGALTNTATVNSDTPDLTPGNDSSTNETTVTAISDLSLVKSDSPDPINPAETLTYTLSVSNAGPSKALLVSVSDTLPTGVTFVDATGTDWTCGESAGVVTCNTTSLAVGIAADITIHATAPADGGTLANTATVTSSASDPNPANNSSTANTTVTAISDLSLIKSDSPDPVNSAGTLTYTLSVSNAGPSKALLVSVSDTLPTGVTFVDATGTGWNCGESAGAVTCSMASLAVGSAADITIHVTTPADGGSLENTATVTSAASDPNPGNNTSTANTSLTAISDLSLIKSDSPDPINPAGTLTYTLSVSNAGPSKALLVSVTDTLPIGVTFVDATGTDWSCGESAGVVTCNMASLTVGSAADITIHVTAPADGGILANTATITSSASDPNPANNSSTANTTVTAISDLSLIKSDSPDPVNSAGTLTYTLSVSNAGPSKALLVSVSDTLPTGVTFVDATGTGWSCGQSAGVVTCSMASLTVGIAADITIHVTAPANGGTLANTATVTSSASDPNPANNTSTANTTVTAISDLSIIKSGSPDQVKPRGIVTYTLSVSNAGPSKALLVSVSDTLPTGVTFVDATGTDWTCGQSAGVVTCYMTSLAVGSAANITIHVTAPANGGILSNTATVGSITTDPAPSNNASNQVNVLIFYSNYLPQISR